VSLWYLLLIVLVVIVIPQADARTVNDIGIVLSKKCVILIQNNINEHCPTNEQLLALFPDTSPRDQIGGFDYINGIFQREPIPTGIQLCRNYLHGLTDEFRLWIDPPGCISPYLKLITIESNFNDYPIKSLSYDMTNNTITMGNQRYVNFGCTQSIINAGDWIFLTGDTIQYMNHNCNPAFTNFDSLKKYSFAKPYHDIATSSKYKQAEFVKAAIEKYSKQSYIGTNDQIENKSVTTDEDER